MANQDNTTTTSKSEGRVLRSPPLKTVMLAAEMAAADPQLGQWRRLLRPQRPFAWPESRVYGWAS
jgi:hypothetical protein